MDAQTQILLLKGAILLLAIVFVVLYTRKYKKTEQDMSLYLESVRMYERVTCPNCRIKITKEWEKLRDKHENNS